MTTTYDTWKMTPPAEADPCDACDMRGKWCRACGEESGFCACMPTCAAWLQYVADDEAKTGSAYAFEDRWIECEACEGEGVR